MRLAQRDEAKMLAVLADIRGRRCLTLPTNAYRADGSVMVYRDNLSQRLSRHLHGKLIGPLAHREYLLRTCGTPGCENPFHHRVSLSTAPPRERCANGHQYTESNTLPPGGQYRCRTCRDSRNARRRTPGGTRRGYCRQGHRLSRSNSYISTDRQGRTHHRCRQCTLAKRKHERNQK